MALEGATLWGKGGEQNKALDEGEFIDIRAYPISGKPQMLNY